VGRARAKIDLPVQVSAAEALWYDVQRRPAFVDGFASVAKLEGDWPRDGARLVWDSVPAGRGRVVERVVDYEVRTGQSVAVEDAQLTGTQTVIFVPRPEGRSQLVLELRWELKQRHVFTPLLDLLFVRRAFADSLRRTLSRFGREVRVEGQVF
jgi:hypothetical protein